MQSPSNNMNVDECLGQVKRLLELLPAVEVVRERKLPPPLRVRLLLSVQSPRSLAALAHISRSANVQLSVEVDWGWQGAPDNPDLLWYEIYLSLVPKTSEEDSELQMFGGFLARYLKRSGLLEVDRANRLVHAWNFYVE